MVFSLVVFVVWMDGCCKDVMIDDVLPTTTMVQAKMNEMCCGIILFLCVSQINHFFYVQFWDHLVKRMDLKVAENSPCVNSGAKEVQLLAGIIAGASDPNAIHEAKKAVDKLCRAAMDIVMKDPNKVSLTVEKSSMKWLRPYLT